MKPNQLASKSHGLVAIASLQAVPMLLAVSAACADYRSIVLSAEPLAYYRLNEMSPPTPDVATNRGSIGSDGNGFYTTGTLHPVPGALVGSTDTAARFSAVDTNSIDGGVPVLVLWPERPMIRELWDNVASNGASVLNGLGN